MYILIVYPTVELVAFMKEVAAAAPNTPFYLYDINFMTGVYCKYRLGVIDREWALCMRHQISLPHTTMSHR